MSKNPTNVSANTLGNIATLYGIGVQVLKDMILLHDDLQKEVDLYTKDVKHKGSKLLPPILVAKIFETLGQP